ncbi:MAG TPA: hypothetical protein VN436_11975 [Holophaga sp.]|nr:hypothetical protein [Holophaga sp.]
MVDVQTVLGVAFHPSVLGDAGRLPADGRNVFGDFGFHGEADHLCELAPAYGELVQLHHLGKPSTTPMCLVRMSSLKPSRRLDLTWNLIRKAAEGW